MENTSSSSNKREKRGMFAQAIERCRSFGNGSSVMRNDSESDPSSPRPGFWNQSKSTSFHGSTRRPKKRNSFAKTFQRSWSLSSWFHDMRIKSRFNSTSPMPRFMRRSKSVGRVMPAGCFAVCVGPTQERFVIKTVCLNHPLFQRLLQQAENEFGFASDGPLMLPCDVETFRQVMLEMEQQNSPDNSPGCNFSRSPYRYGLVSQLATSFRN